MLLSLGQNRWAWLAPIKFVLVSHAIGFPHLEWVATAVESVQIEKALQSRGLEGQEFLKIVTADI
ncbi:MAG: hypothetical protein ACKO5P_05745, partial [Nodosilinea sp.]